MFKCTRFQRSLESLENILFVFVLRHFDAAATVLLSQHHDNSQNFSMTILTRWKGRTQVTRAVNGNCSPFNTLCSGKKSTIQNRFHFIVGEDILLFHTKAILALIGAIFEFSQFKWVASFQRKMFAIVLSAALHHTSFINWTNGWKCVRFQLMLPGHINWKIEWRQQRCKVDSVQSSIAFLGFNPVPRERLRHHRNENKLTNEVNKDRKCESKQSGKKWGLKYNGFIRVISLLLFYQYLSLGPEIETIICDVSSRLFSLRC